MTTQNSYMTFASAVACENARRRATEDKQVLEVAQRRLWEAMEHIRCDIATYNDMIVDDQARVAAHPEDKAAPLDLVKNVRYRAGLEAAIDHLARYGLL